MKNVGLVSRDCMQWWTPADYDPQGPQGVCVSRI